MNTANLGRRPQDEFIGTIEPEHPLEHTYRNDPRQTDIVDAVEAYDRGASAIRRTIQ